MESLVGYFDAIPFLTCCFRSTTAYNYDSNKDDACCLHPPVDVCAVMYFNIIDLPLATFGFKNVRKSLIERAQITLKILNDGHNLDYLETNRKQIAELLQNDVSHLASVRGVNIDSIIIEDVRLLPTFAI